jgi:hypothetical protein
VPVRRLLFLDSLGLRAYRWQGGALHAEADFSADGLPDFDAYLKGRNTSLFYLLADVADESFQIEELPHVRGRDRAEMLKRKLAQHCHGAPLALAQSLGRARSGRRDEKFLFAGLTGDAQFAPWLQALRNAQARLTGVYSVPFLLPMLAAKFIGKTQPALLITITRAGLRQSFFDGGQLRFSRLTPMDTRLPVNTATACDTETRKICQYLAGQRMIARGQPLVTLILAHPGEFSSIGEHCASTPERTVQMVDLLTESAAHGLKTAPADSRADALLLRLLARKAPAAQFAPPIERRQFRLWQTRLGLNLAAGIILVLSLLYTGLEMQRYAGLANANSLLQSEISLGQRHYEAMLRSLPPVDIRHEDLRVLTDRYLILERRSPGPAPMFQVISRALDQSPAVDIDKLDWWLANSPGEMRGTTMDASQPAVDGSGYAIALIHGRLPFALADDHKNQTETINGFAEKLRAPNMQVQIVSLPFEAKSGKAIRNTDTGGLLEPPVFALKVAQKL